MSVNNTDRVLCPICGSGHITSFMEVNQVPIHCNLLWNKQEQAINAPLGDIELGFCSYCGHVYNYRFDPLLMEYDAEYENSLHFSKVFQRFAKKLAQELIQNYHLQNKKILEIGCGQGDFLRMLCELGNNTGYGFDPSYILDGQQQNEQIHFIKDFYSEEYSGYEADLIVSRHVLEHISDPLKFLKSIRNSLEGSTDTPLYFEVPNVMYTLKDLGIWDIIYEHCSYFSADSLRYVFEACKFSVEKLEEAFGKQFLGIHAYPVRKLIEPHSPDLHKTMEIVKEFRKEFETKYNAVNQKLEKLRLQGEKPVLWGAGSKGVTFLNIMKTKGFIDYIVDINPRKLGKYVAGTGQEIIAPESLVRHRPNTIIILNPNYLDEIKQTAVGLGVEADFWVV